MNAKLRIDAVRCWRPLMVALMLAAPTPAPAAPPEKALATATKTASASPYAGLIDTIATGDAQAARDAEDEVLDRLLGELGPLIGSIEGRPIEEQIRLQHLLSRLSANLRLRAYRASVPPEDRAKLDRFLAVYPELGEQIFQDIGDTRIAALRKLPLEPNTGAGVLVAAALNDSDPAVLETAFNVAAQLHDESVARGTMRFLREVVALLKTDHYAGVQAEALIGYTDYVHKAVYVLGETGYRPAAPVVLDTLAFFSDSVARKYLDIGAFGLALGKLGDSACVDPLLPYLDNTNFRRGDPNSRARQTHGDAVLWGLLTLYGLDPADYGFFTIKQPRWEFFGFESDDARAAAVRKFRTWLKEHRDQPAAASTQPTHGD